MRLSAGGTEVASYVVRPELDIRLGPRPYLHPVRTLGGTTVTDALCFDHPWHLGASLSMQDVNGVNLWGGRTYVRGQGYVWREDHGRIVHAAWLPAETGFAERLTWQDGRGGTLLTEDRAVAAHLAPHGWQLSFAYTLTAPPGKDVTLGSPATNGREGGAGYGGFFWRAAPALESAAAPSSGREGRAGGEGRAGEGSAGGQGGAGREGSAEGEGGSEARAGAVRMFTAAGPGGHGSAEPWVALAAGDAYTLVFRGLSGDDRWFVRTDDYPGVCAALAYDKPLTIPAGTGISRSLTVLVADGALTPAQMADS
jgi:methane monooxygenase PmoA-like